MPRVTEGFCCSDICNNPLPSGIGTATFHLVEEKDFDPVAGYCSCECATYIRGKFYKVDTGKVNGVYPWTVSRNDDFDRTNRVTGSHHE